MIYNFATQSNFHSQGKFVISHNLFLFLYIYTYKYKKYTCKSYIFAPLGTTELNNLLS